VIPDEFIKYKGKQYVHTVGVFSHFIILQLTSAEKLAVPPGYLIRIYW
jgi:hypothetical protein